MIAKKVKDDTVDKNICFSHEHVVVFKCTYDTIRFSIRYQNGLPSAGVHTNV